MKLVDQPLSQFAVLTVTGIVMSAATGALLSDYRGLLTSYVQRLWRSYQKPWYRKTFLWTDRQRTSSADATKIRLSIRLTAGFGLLMGLSILAIEVAALVTGHVT